MTEPEIRILKVTYVEITMLIHLNLYSQMLEYESFEAIQLLDHEP